MSQPARLRIGSRGSDLALWQARHVQSCLKEPADIVVIKTRGDEIQHLSLDKVEGKGFFTKEIEAALLAREVDIAVHSYKDLPTEAVPGLLVAAVPARAPIEDVLVRRADAPSSAERWGLPHGARVGTSSLRRQAQLRSRRADLELVMLRGNVPTRVGRVTSGELDAVVLARAGLTRLGFIDGPRSTGLAVHTIPIDDVCPAPAQGALAIQVRADDAHAQRAVHVLHDELVARCVTTERALLRRFGGGCHLPLGASCSIAQGELWLRALVAAPDGHERLTAEARGVDPDHVADDVHRQLVAAGAERYL